MDIPTNSPWGKVQDSTVIAEGIIAVTTAGHGGIKLSRQRNAKIPEQWRVKGGWYEEDCDWAIPEMVFRQEFLDHYSQRRLSVNLDKAVEVCEKTCKDWHPGFYTAFTRISLTPKDSYLLAKQEFQNKTVDQFVVKSAHGSGHDIPEKFVGVMAKKGNETKRFLVPQAEYDKRSQFGFIITKKYKEWKISS